MTNPEFQVHILNQQGIEKAKQIADIFDKALNEIAPLIPVSSRETSCVRTHMELASFYAKKAMAKQIDNQA